MLWTALLALCALGLLAGCEERVKQAAPASKRLSASQLLDIPVHALANPASPTQAGKHQFQLPEVEHLQVLWRDRKGQEQLVRLYKDGKGWWAVWQKDEGEAWGYSLKVQANLLHKTLRSLKELAPAHKSEFAPERVRVQLSLFAARRRFLMRILQAPVDHGPTAIYKGEWLVYHHGNLYEQAANGALGQSVPTLLRALKNLRYRKDGMLLPLQSASMNFRTVRDIAKALHKQRMSLKRCFKKRRFPSSIGPLRMQLMFKPEGKIKKLRILTRKHTKHKVVWCVWWFAKKFKLDPVGIPSLKYNLVIPPGGP